MNAKLVSCLLASILCTGCASAYWEQPIDLLGAPAPVESAGKTIVLASGQDHVNVTGGEIVRFVSGQKSFAWSFDGPLTVSRFDLLRVAPPGLLDHSVIAYVAPNPMYLDEGRHGGHRGGDRR